MINPSEKENEKILDRIAQIKEDNGTGVSKFIK